VDEILPRPWDKSCLKAAPTTMHVGAGEYADIIAVSGNPLTDISEMLRVRFVMKGGFIVKKDL
jgi:hypothetical protein